MRILVNDHSGHPFQVQLSRALAATGHEVLHCYSASFQTPKGRLERSEADPPGFQVTGITLAEPFAKYSFLKRRRQEREYARRLIGEIDRFGPDAVLSSNMPLEGQRLLVRACNRRRIPFVFWVQDIYSLAIERIVAKRSRALGKIAGWYYRGLERRQLAASQAIILITEDFRPLMDSWNVPAHRCTVIPNWAPLDELSEQDQVNAWSRRHGLAGRRVLLYAGTLGMKHNPALLAHLASFCKRWDDVVVVVASEGLGADWLRDERERRGLDNLVLMGFQPFDEVPQMLSSATVLLGILEADAGMYSVPSKVLTYLCFRRPLALSVPRENLAARIITDSGAGVVVEPGDAEGLARAVGALLEDPEAREVMGNEALRYARVHFDLDRIKEAFESTIMVAVETRS